VTSPNQKSALGITNWFYSSAYGSGDCAHEPLVLYKPLDGRRLIFDNEAFINENCQRPTTVATRGSKLANSYGGVAKWLGTALQKPQRWFDSNRHLQIQAKQENKYEKNHYCCGIDFFQRLRQSRPVCEKLGERGRKHFGVRRVLPLYQWLLGKY
jgi:hypothetical protein